MDQRSRVLGSAILGLFSLIGVFGAVLTALGVLGMPSPAAVLMAAGGVLIMGAALFGLIWVGSDVIPGEWH